MKKKKVSSTFAQRVSANLVALRTKKGMTQDEVIAKSIELGMEISRRTYGDLERGTASPTVKTMAKLEAIFNCSISDLSA